MWQVQHLEDLRLILRGRCSTRSISVSFCVASAAVGTPPERSAEVRRRLNTMDAGCFCLAGAALGGTQSHFAWQVQHLEHCHLTPSASFVLIPLLLFFVVASSLFCFLDLFHTWMSEDIVNMWGFLVL